MLDGPDRSLTRPAGQRLSQWGNCECRAWCSLLRKPSTARSATHFSMSAHHISSKGPQLQFDRHVQTSFENNIFRPTGEWEKRRQRHGSVQPQTSWISSDLACFFFFFTLQTFAIDEDSPCHPTVWISKPKRHLLYVRQTSTMYSVRLRSGARHGETPRIGGNPKNQPISELVIFSKRQALSRAVVVNSNMSRGKCLAREGPGSRLDLSTLTALVQDRNQRVCAKVENRYRFWGFLLDAFSSSFIPPTCTCSLLRVLQPALTDWSWLIRNQARRRRHDQAHWPW